MVYRKPDAPDAAQDYTSPRQRRTRQQYIVPWGRRSVLLRSSALRVDCSSSLPFTEVLVLHIHAQNAALILRRLRDTMVFEAFEVSATPEAVMEVDGKLICSYPGPAVELPLDVAHDPSFVEQLVSFLVQMDVDQLDVPTTTKASPKFPKHEAQLTHDTSPSSSL
jgi:hypothetical protein